MFSSETKRKTDKRNLPLSICTRSSPRAKYFSRKCRLGVYSWIQRKNCHYQSVRPEFFILFSYMSARLKILRKKGARLPLIREDRKMFSRHCRKGTSHRAYRQIHTVLFLIREKERNLPLFFL